MYNMYKEFINMHSKLDLIKDPLLIVTSTSSNRPSDQAFYISTPANLVFIVEVK